MTFYIVFALVLGVLIGWFISVPIVCALLIVIAVPSLIFCRKLNNSSGSGAIGAYLVIILVAIFFCSIVISAGLRTGYDHRDKFAEIHILR